MVDRGRGVRVGFVDSGAIYCGTWTLGGERVNTVTIPGGLVNIIVRVSMIKYIPKKIEENDQKREEREREKQHS